MPAGKKVRLTVSGPPPGIPAADIEYRPVRTNHWPVPYDNAPIPAQDNPPNIEDESSFSGAIKEMWNGGGNIETRQIFGVVVILFAIFLAVVRAAPGVVIFDLVIGLVLVLPRRNTKADDDDFVDAYNDPYGYMHPALAREVAHYSQRGYRVVSQTPAGVHMIRPKRFSFFWAFLWFLLLFVGLVVYLLYYASKRDESIYLRLGRDGQIVTRRGRS